MNFVYVFIGGGLGAMSRYSISKITPYTTHGFPWATFIANMISCLILGFLMGWLWTKGMNSGYKLLLMTGFCGGFSTFSTFSAETYSLLENGQYSLAFIYIASSIIICLGLILLGIKLSHIV